ncbi:MAG: hypothetical protein K8R35_08000 [Bacteroidales bacterium]|nr:hypothetical protein [Bacteroidales bacterium]
MRQRLIVTIITIVLGTPLFSQADRIDRIEAEKIAFFTKRLDLSSEEAQKFWPVYNDFSSRKDNIVKERNELMRDLRQNIDNLSDKEVEESGDKLISFIIEDAELTRIYHEKFKEVLPPAKVVRIYSTEIQFRTMLLNRLRQRREQQAPGGRRIPGNMN